MTETIRFPHLHITLNHVGQYFNLFGFHVAFYGCVIALGMILGVMMILHEAKRTGQSEDNYLDIAIWTLIFSVIGARIYYVVFAWDLYKDNLLSVFNIRQGGLAIYGGVLAGILTAFIVCKIKKMPFLLVADTCIIGLPIGQMLGRWGNFFNREAFGGYTDSLFAMQIPLDAVRQEGAVTQEMMEHLKTIKGVEYISVHPTFLYESLWSLGVFLLLFFMRKHVRFHGQQFLTYLVAYGAGRFWIEGLRTDQLFLTGTSIPVSQLLAAIMVVFGIIMLIVGNRRAAVSGNEPQEEAVDKTAETAAGEMTESGAEKESPADKKDEDDSDNL
jgi:phosphatidylglycerol:prolipoprotein diacylglycerol transferase